MPHTRRRLHWIGHLLPPAVVCLIFSFVYRGDLETDPSREPMIAAPPTVAAPQAPSWRAAARRVEEPRGERVGRAASVDVPATLRHYADTRRFLAIQVAAAREQGYELPLEEADLVPMIHRGELVEMPPLGDDYILYGVGANASEGPLSHDDPVTRAEVPLFARWDLAQDAIDGQQAEVERQQAAVEEAKAALKRVTAREARRRRTLSAQVRQAQARIAEIKKQQALIRAWYDDYDRRRELTSDWQVLEEQAHSFGKRAYDLDLPKDRRAFRARLLSFLRPPARDLLLEIAHAYRERFGRPLAITSLVRTASYQRQLAETNPNATHIGLPPHTTGLAFDLFYRYMTAEEQDFVMDLIGSMEKAGRVEALRENRDHIHVFVFALGRRPPETLIAEALGYVRPTRVAAERTRTPVARTTRPTRSADTPAKPRVARRAAARKR